MIKFRVVLLPRQMSRKFVQNFVTVRYPVTSLDLTNPRISKVLVCPGQRIRADTLLVSVETDKAIFDISSDYSGLVTSVAVKEGQHVFEDNDLVTILGD